MTGWNLISVPYARRQEVMKTLKKYLEQNTPGHADQIQTETIKGREFSLRPRLQSSARAPRVFACYDRPLPTWDEPTTFLVTDGRWDLGFAAAVSRATGGFSIAAESWPLISQASLAVFYAGVPVQYWRKERMDRDDHREQSPRTGAEEVSERLHSILKAALKLDGLLIQPMIRPARSTIVEISRTSERPDFDPLRLPSTPPLHCAFYADVDEDRMQRALDDSPDLKWRISLTSLDVPYGVVLGVEPSHWEQWLTVQQRADTQSMGMSLFGLSAPQWWSAGPDRLPIVGVARDAFDLIERAGGFADLLDTNPADLRVPVSTN